MSTKRKGHKGRRLIGVLLAALLVIVLVPAQVFAEEAEKIVKNTYEMIEGDIESTNKDWTLYVFSGDNGHAETTAVVNGSIINHNGSGSLGVDNGKALYVRADWEEGATANVSGNVISEGNEGVYTYTYDKGTTTANVFGDVSVTTGRSNAGVRAEAPTSGGTSRIYVEGNVYSNAAGIKTNSNGGLADVFVMKNVISDSDGIYTVSKNGGESRVIVAENIESGNYGVFDYSTTDGGKTYVNVYGSVTAAPASGAAGTGIYGGANGSDSMTDITTGDVISEKGNGLIVSAYNYAKTYLETGDVVTGADNYLHTFCGGYLDADLGDVTLTSNRGRGAYGDYRNALYLLADNRQSTKDTTVDVAAGNIWSNDQGETVRITAEKKGSLSSAVKLTAGKITSVNSTGIGVYGPGDYDVQTEDVTAKDFGVYASTRSTTHLETGDITSGKRTYLCAYDGGQTTAKFGDLEVPGDSGEAALEVVAGWTGTSSAPTGSVTVDAGTITGAYGLNAYTSGSGNKISVTSDWITAANGTGVKAIGDDDNEVEIIVIGGIESYNEGLYLESPGFFSVYGDVTATGRSSGSQDFGASGLSADGDYGKQNILVSGRITGAENAVDVYNPDNVTLTTWAIVAPEGEELFYSDEEGEAEAFAETVNYIVEVEQPEEGGTVKAVREDGSELATSREFNVAHQGERVYLKIDLEPGWRVVGAWNGLETKTALSKDGDRYYCEVPEGGGVYLSVELANGYKVTFEDEDGTPLQKEYLQLNEMPEYKGDEPTKTATPQYSYKFVKWNPDVVPVAGDAVYTAEYRQILKSYTVTFKNYDGTVLQSGKVPYGETPAYNGETPTREAPDDRHEYVFAGWDPAVTQVTGDAVYTAVLNLVDKDPVAAFVTRPYDVCLNRLPDEAGLASWVSQLKAGKITGVKAAQGFVFSQEFQNRNYCNRHFVEQLYRAFMGREYDEGGLAYWINKLETGSTREAVFNGFALSPEFTNLCSDYGINRGGAIGVGKWGTVPKGPCTMMVDGVVCGEEDGVTAFVKRLYAVCLDRDADAGGLANWTNQLWNHTKSGKQVAFGFVFSAEFTGKNHSNEKFVDYMYQAFFGRDPDAGGKANWVRQLNAGKSRLEVFNGFADSKEFSNLCLKYGILAT